MGVAYALGLVACGVVLVVGGLVVALGAWAAVACGAVLIVAGLVVPWDRLTVDE